MSKVLRGAKRFVLRPHRIADDSPLQIYRSGLFAFFFADGPARFPSPSEDIATFVAISFSGIYIAG